MKKNEEIKSERKDLKVEKVNLYGQRELIKETAYVNKSTTNSS